MIAKTKTYLQKEFRIMSNYATINPATGERVAEFPTLTDEEVQDALKRSFTEYRTWRSTPLAERAAVLTRVAELHRERSEELAALLTLEMGKPIAEARGEVALVASIYAYYADNAERFLRDEPLEIRDPARPWSAPNPSDRWSGSCPGTSPTTRSPASPHPT